METKNNNAIYIVGALVLGLLAGYLVWGTDARGSEMHMMSDGTMMHDEEMGMEAMMHDMMMGLEGKTGDEFDKAFLSEMIVHHEGAVDMAEAVRATAKRPELVKLANDIISAQTKEISMMKSWLSDWYGE